jgi:KaiC/GvpD/RAD55 family RecA-like ATPase
MGIIRNTTEGIHPIREGGFKRGEMAIVSAGHQTGKSTMSILKSRIYNANLC